MAEVTRVVIPIDTMEVESWHEAARAAVGIASANPSPATDIILLTHTKDQLGPTELAGHVGDPAVKALLKGARLPLVGDITLRHATLKTLGYSARNSVIIAFYADDRMLETLDGLPGVKGIVAVPDLPDGLSSWKERWNPRVPGEDRPDTVALIDDPVIERALEAITLRSNIAYNTLQQRDKETANEILRILRAKGHTLDAGKIKSWAIRRGWKPGAADILATVANKVASLKSKPSLAGIYDPDGRYERWKNGE